MQTNKIIFYHKTNRMAVQITGIKQTSITLLNEIHLFFYGLLFKLLTDAKDLVLFNVLLCGVLVELFLTLLAKAILTLVVVLAGEPE